MGGREPALFTATNVLRLTILELISLALYAVSLTTLSLAALLLHKAKDRLAMDFIYIGLCILVLASLSFISTSL